MKSGLEIAQEAILRPIGDVAADAGLLPDEVEPYGRGKAKIEAPAVLARLGDRPDGKIVITTAITPTKAGEGKTTSSISLTQGLARIGVRSAMCLREPSMGPIFGIKGGGTGGGYTQILPMEDINLHLTGDFHAVTAAHNLLAAALDASLFHGNPLGISPWSITWPRTLDVNDRALRKEIIGLGGRLDGVPRESEFVITAASEIMAILALATDLEDLRARLGQITVGQDGDGKPVTAEDLRVAGAMTVILKDAIRPNLVQTLEGQPVFIHAGPFGNIAHANNSIIADRVALKSADLVVTEAGFGSDLGFEKFCHIVCRSAGFAPSAALLVATVRALKAHGGVPESVAGTTDDPEALKRGSENLAAHIDIVRAFGLPVVVGVNRFPNDSDADLDLLTQLAVDYGADEVVMNDGFTRGGEGAEDLAAAVVRVVEKPNSYAPLNAPGTSIRDQIETIATRVYGADRVEFAAAAERRLAGLAALGLDTLPVCMAKTHLSLSHDPLLKGRPRGFVLPVRDVVPSTGAGFVVALCGEMMRMPGLGRDPAFTKIDVDATGRTVGMF